MRTSVASLGNKLLPAFFAAALALGLMPIMASASEAVPADEPVARAESTSTYFLARTLESTRTVPVVSAELLLDVDAAEEVVGSFSLGGITYAMEPGGESVAVVAVDPAKLSSGFWDEQTMELPSSVAFDGADPYAVARIADEAFSSLASAAEENLHTGIVTLIVPASVIEIGDEAFKGFDTLQRIIVSEGNLAYGAYDGCLYDTALTSLLLIPEGRVGAVRIAPSTVTIDPEVFSHCPSVDEVIVDADSAAFYSENGCLYSKDPSTLIFAPASSSVEAEVHDSEEELLETSERAAYAANTITVNLNGGTAYMGYQGQSGTKTGTFTLSDSTAIIGNRFGSIWKGSQTQNDWLISSVSRTGYTFAGWSLSNNYGAPWTALTADTVFPNGSTVYALWYSNVTVDGNGGFLLNASGQTVTRISVATGYTYQFNANGACWPNDRGGTFAAQAGRAGYRFVGWSTDKNATTGGTTGTGPGPGTGYAIWNPVTYSIAYNANGGTFSGGATSYTIESDDIALPTVGVRTGYTFAGWDVTGESGSGIAGNGTTSVVVKAGTYGNLTATAKWVANEYAVSFDANGGTGGQTSALTATYDAPMSGSPLAPVRDGYSFAGWWDVAAPTGGTMYYRPDGTSATAWNKDSNATLYARWSADSYALRLHANDETEAMIEHTVTYDAAVAAADVPKRYGYIFSGYYAKEADGSKGDLYFDANGSYVRDAGLWKGLEAVDLHAAWTLMGDLEVPITAPSSVSFLVDRATGTAHAQDGSPSSSGVIRSAMPQEVPLSSLALEALIDGSGASLAEKLLGAGNPERCAMEVAFSPGAATSQVAVMRLANPAGSTKDATVWEFASGDAPVVPAAQAVAAGSTGDGIVMDDLGNLARAGELTVAYALRTLAGFDVYAVPLADATEVVARIVFTVDLTGLDREKF